MASYVLEPAIRLVDGVAIGYGRTLGLFHARRDGTEWFVYGYIDGDENSGMIAKVAGRRFSRQGMLGYPRLVGFRTKAQAEAVAARIGKE